MRIYHLAWWNLENLFDEENAVALGRRTDKVFRAIKNDIAGWTAQLRDDKINQLASVIVGMNGGQDPICSACARWKTVSSSIGSSTAWLPRCQHLGIIRSFTPTPGMPAESTLHSSTTTLCSRVPHLLKCLFSFTW